MDEFTEAYIECALWSTNDESTPQGGVQLYKNYSVDDIAPETLAQMEKDCEEFQHRNFGALYRHARMYDSEQYSTDENAGKDFWLTRNGHGAGFGDEDYPTAFDRQFRKEAKRFGEYNLYVGDDGKIYGM